MTALLLLGRMSPAQWWQAIFALASGLILTVQLLPARTSRRLLTYGPRELAGRRKQQQQQQQQQSASQSQPRDHGDDDEYDDDDGFLARALARATSVGQVPHQWFIHFYICSVAASVFWAYQLLTAGRPLMYLALLQAEREDEQQRHRPTAGPGLGQVGLVWAMMLLQGARRLYECVVVMRPGGSSMWFVHWLMGIGFYVGVSVAVWIEGSASILAWIRQAPPPAAPTSYAIPLRSAIAPLGLYIFASLHQHRAHKYLASLQKYTLPTEGSFRWVVCPHYTAECLIYTAMAMAAAPEGYLLNRTILSALLFAAINLGATGAGTKVWYEHKFGRDRVASRWIMIPAVF